MTANRGPLPKRSEERMRANEPDIPIDKVVMSDEEQAAADRRRPAKSHWEPVVKEWWDGLAYGPQARYYTSADWAVAEFLAEAMSRDFGERIVSVQTVKAFDDETRSHTTDVEVIRERTPITGASIGAYLKGMSLLMMTEADRRRMRIEVERQPHLSAVPDPTPISTDDARADLLG